MSGQHALEVEKPCEASIPIYYAESGIRILKDIVFRRVKAYNLVQLFEFLTVTFELYYECRLLAVAHNRMDRYIITVQRTRSIESK